MKNSLETPVQKGFEVIYQSLLADIIDCWKFLSQIFGLIFRAYFGRDLVSIDLWFIVNILVKNGPHHEWQSSEDEIVKCDKPIIKYTLATESAKECKIELWNSKNPDFLIAKSTYFCRRNKESSPSFLYKTIFHEPAIISTNIKILQMRSRCFGRLSCLHFHKCHNLFFRDYFLPKCASCIILTSFAPSPMAKVILFSPSFIVLTTQAFYRGVTRQHTTELQSLLISMNFFVNSSFPSIIANDSPSTIKEIFFFSFWLFLKML